MIGESVKSIPEEAEPSVKITDASTTPAKTYPAPRVIVPGVKTEAGAVSAGGMANGEGAEAGRASRTSSSDSTAVDMPSCESINSLEDYEVVTAEDAVLDSASNASNPPVAAGAKPEATGAEEDVAPQTADSPGRSAANKGRLENAAAAKAHAAASITTAVHEGHGDGEGDDDSDTSSTHSLALYGKAEPPDSAMRMGFDSEDEGDDGDGLGANDDPDGIDDDGDEEAAARARMDAELEMNLRRAELRHVELELKLVSAEEEVRKAKEVLAQAELARETFQKQAHEAWEEVGEAERLIAEERMRREEEDAARYLAERQAQAIVEADDLRQKGNEAYRQGKSSEAETLYKMAIDELEMCEIVLEEPSHLTLRTNRAAALMALGRTREALSECEMVLEINPCNIRALSRAANCCIKLGDLDAAKNHVDDICLSPDATASDLQAAADQHQKIIAASVERDRLVGNDSYRHGDYHGALRWYNAALTAAKEANDTDALKSIMVGLHTNRAAAYLMIGNPLHAAEDCCSALRLDSGHTKAQVRLARCLLQLGDFSEARQEASDIASRSNAELQSKSEARNVLKDIETVEGILQEVGDKLKIAEGLQQSVDDDNFDICDTAQEALAAIDAAILIAPQVPDLITLKAEALRLAGKAEEALALISGKKAINARRRFIEARLHYDLGNLGACIAAGEHVLDMLQMVPKFKVATHNKNPVDDQGAGDEDEEKDHKTEEKLADGSEKDDEFRELAAVPDPEGLLTLLDRASKINKCKDDGRDAFFQNKHQEALGLYTEALLLSSGTPMLEGLFLSNICACEQSLGKYADALSSAGTAVAIAPTFVKAHSRLATLYAELDMLADASEAYKTLLKMPLESSEATQARSSLATVTAKSRNNRPVNWYKLLGVEASAGAAEIKKAYRQLALVHHPDKAGRGGVSAEVAKARAEMSCKLFKQVGEAQRVLTNAAERSKWESAKAQADRRDSYTKSSYSSSSWADPFGDYRGSRYDRSASHWSDMYEEDDNFRM